MEEQEVYFRIPNTDTESGTLRIGLEKRIVDLINDRKFTQNDYMRLTTVQLFAIVLRELQLYYQYLGTRFERLCFYPWMDAFAREFNKPNDRISEFYFYFVPKEKQWEFLALMEQVVQNKNGMDARIFQDLDLAISRIKGNLS